MLIFLGSPAAAQSEYVNGLHMCNENTHMLNVEEYGKKSIFFIYEFAQEVMFLPDM